MKKRTLGIVVAGMMTGAAGAEPAQQALSGSLFVYCAGGVKPPVAAIAQQFEKETGVKVELTYANSGQLLGQIQTTGRGDIYIPGDVGFAAKAQEKKLTAGEPREFCYFVPALYVRKGNPKGIQDVADLARPGLKLALADPSAALGPLQAQVFAKNRLDAEAIKKNTAISPPMVTDVLLAVKMGTVDAGIVWDAFADFAPAEAELVRIPPEKNVIGTVAACVLASSRNRPAADALLDYLVSEKGRTILKANGYTVDHPARAAKDAARFAGRTIELFVGAASKPATEEAGALFEKQTGAKLVLHFGGSGQMLSQLRLAGRGDLYFPGSSDYMELAKREKDVLPETEKIVAYLVPAINVPKGNPKNIARLEDLAKPGVRVGIARPDAVCVGLYAAELLEKSGLAARVRPNIVTQTESCEKTAQLVALGSVDAVIGWEVFQHWQPEKIESILLPPEQVCRIGFIPIAVARKTKDRALAEAFIAFLLAPDGQAVFRKWHYLTGEEDARKFAQPTTPVGGEWRLPEPWK